MITNGKNILNKYAKPDSKDSVFLFYKEMDKLAQRRLTLAKESWIENIMRIQGYSRQKAEELFEKIKPNLGNEKSKSI